jgi:hypothetical protein
MVKPNSKNRMNLCASPHPRHVQRVRVGPPGRMPESASLPAFEQSPATAASRFSTQTKSDIP